MVRFEETVDHPGCFLDRLLRQRRHELAGLANVKHVGTAPDSQTDQRPRAYMKEVTLPSTPCTACTIRVRQVMMESRGGEAAPCPPMPLGNTPTYFSCANVVLKARRGGADGGRPRTDANGVDMGGSGGAGGNTGGTGWSRRHRRLRSRRCFRRRRQWWQRRARTGGSGGQPAAPADRQRRIFWQRRLLWRDDRRVHRQWWLRHRWQQHWIGGSGSGGRGGSSGSGTGGSGTTPPPQASSPLGCSVGAGQPSLVALGFAAALLGLALRGRRRRR